MSSSEASQIQHFKKPIPVVWTARFDGCLVSCWGVAFTRVPEDLKRASLVM